MTSISNSNSVSLKEEALSAKKKELDGKEKIETEQSESDAAVAHVVSRERVSVREEREAVALTESLESRLFSFQREALLAHGDLDPERVKALLAE